MWRYIVVVVVLVVAIIIGRWNRPWLTNDDLHDYGKGRINRKP